MAGMDLGKQVGPLPLGAWIAVVAGGLGIALWTKQNQVSDEPEITEDVSGDEGVGTGPGWVAVPPPSTTPPDSTAPKPTTNEEWGSVAINWLIGKGYPAGIANSAITKALAGGVGDNKLSVQEWSLWTIVLAAIGAPPYPIIVPPPTGVPGPVTPNPPKPPTNPPPTTTPKVRYYVVKPWPAKGSTLWGIAEIYYKDGRKWSKIYNANKKGTTRADRTPGMISNPNLIRPGWKLIVPQ
jgi:nucleoid-associated protein YgaU